jgi:N-dimethylarginine dimethylaminohydrolase
MVETINISVSSETGALKTVVMYLANPMSVSAFLRQGGFDLSVVYQAWHNKWGFYDDRKVRQQQKVFIALMEANGVRVLYAEEVPGCITQHYTRDMGFVIDDTFYCANPRRYTRQREQAGLRDLLPRFSKVVRLEQGTIEGGDVMIADEQFVLIGLGEETNAQGIQCLRRKFTELGIQRQIIPLEFSHRGVIHLDTKFNIPARGIGLIHPGSFTRASLKWLENHFDLIAVTDAEAAHMEINTFTLSPRKVVMRERSQRLAAILQSKGIEPVLIDYSAVTKLPGSFRCTTLPLERVDPAPANKAHH